MQPVASSRERILERIAKACGRAGRDASTVTLVAVSKQRPVEQTRALYDAGQRDFAENRVQDTRERVAQLPGDVTWHLIGPLQTNKAKYLPGLVAWIHSIDRAESADAVEKAFARVDQTVRVLVQVNISGEESKSGVAPGEALALVRHCASLPHLRVEGLMTMAPYDAEAETTRPVFRGLAELAARLRDETGLALPHLSMGMTNDFEVAVEEGATLVRVGTALYEG